MFYFLNMKNIIYAIKKHIYSTQLSDQSQHRDEAEVIALDEGPAHLNKYELLLVTQVLPV